MTKLPQNISYRQHGVVAPDTDPDSAAWWSAVERGEFLLPSCTACGGYYFPPGPRCPSCGSSELALHDAPLTGRIYSWIVVHYPQDPAFAEDVPYTIVAVHLDAGPRMFGRLLSGEPGSGLRVEARAYRSGEVPLVGFDKSEQ
jgi:uncharacterized protein